LTIRINFISISVFASPPDYENQSGHAGSSNAHLLYKHEA
jgi:hypothetical protein